MAIFSILVIIQLIKISLDGGHNVMRETFLRIPFYIMWPCLGVELLHRKVLVRYHSTVLLLAISLLFKYVIILLGSEDFVFDEELTK